MKRVLLLLCSCFILFFQPIHGQKGFSVGVDFSVRHTSFTSWANFKPFKQTTLRPAFGIFMDYKVKNWIGVRSGLSFDFYTQKLEQSANNFTYLGIPVQIQFYPGSKKTETTSTFQPIFLLGFRPQFLMQAQHLAKEGREGIKRFTESFRYEMTGGIGLTVRLSDQLLMENVVIAELGNPFNTKEYNSTLGAIVNFNLGLKASVIYGLNSNIDP